MGESIPPISTKQRQAQEMSRRLLKIIDMALIAAERADKEAGATERTQRITTNDSETQVCITAGVGTTTGGTGDEK